jgi:hypothetical protein
MLTKERAAGQLKKNGRFGKSHPITGAPSNRKSVLFCTARLREMAFRKQYIINYSLFVGNGFLS